jgi:hypothetical protein
MATLKKNKKMHHHEMANRIEILEYGKHRTKRIST